MEIKQVYSSVMGSVIGDAVGVPYEFTRPYQIELNPCEDMVGYGTYSQPPGTWSDDSSMTLATLDSLAKGLDYDDMIQRFIRWIKDGEYTQYDKVFDYGRTTYNALMQYPECEALDCGLTHERSNGNGSLMRIIPACLYVNAKKLETSEQIDVIDKVSQLTHAHKDSKASCNIYNFIIQEVLDNPDKKLQKCIENGLSKSGKYYNNEGYPCFNRLYDNLFEEDSSDVYSKGYVVNSLEVALYHAYHTDNYKDSIIDVVNTAYDTDTNACITGGLTGLYYGCTGIPESWIEGIPKMDYVKKLCDNFYETIKE